MDIRAEFAAEGYSIINYAKKRGLDYQALKHFLWGRYEGRRRGLARDCALALFSDGILPLTHPIYESVKQQKEDEKQKQKQEEAVCKTPGGRKERFAS